MTLKTTDPSQTGWDAIDRLLRANPPQDHVELCALACDIARLRREEAGREEDTPACHLCHCCLDAPDRHGEILQAWVDRAEQAESTLAALERLCCPVCHAIAPENEKDTPTECSLCAVRDALAALQAQTCETCRYSFVGMAPAGRPHDRLCKRTKEDTGQGSCWFAKCEVLGNGCRAWQAKGGA